MSHGREMEASDDFHEIRIEHQQIGQVPIGVEGLQTPVWQVGEQLQPIGDPSIQVAPYQDHLAIHAELVSAIVADANRQPPNTHGLGGKKVRSNAIWQLPALRLLTLRALTMFCKQYRTRSAHITDRWCNVMERTDYSAAHSHYESMGSVVYFVDPGETHPNHPLSGLFEIMDPRVAFCCSQAAERPTRGLMPEPLAGVMLLFPSELLHSVHPYYGTRPRVTIAWNINPGLRPEAASHSFEAPVEGAFGVV